MNNSLFFTPAKLGPLQLRNRSIRAAAFEGMTPGHEVSDALISYHTALAQGGVGMTTVAYASVNKCGVSFPHQLYMRKEIKASLQKLTAAVHKEGAAVSIQLGHGGNMANRTVTGIRPVAASGGINWYGPTFPRSMVTHDIESLKKDFVQAVLLAAESGFDAVEIHAGHGYLISQFLSPYTNKRKDLYGGKFENRKRLMTEVLRSVREAMPEKMALLVKMNCWDGFEGGITREEGILTAKEIAACGADAVIVSGGFVSRAPMYVMRGKMPVDIMAYFIKEAWKKMFVSWFGESLIPAIPFHEGFFMEAAKSIQNSLSIPVVLVGGMNSIKTINKAMEEGFQFIALARALIHNTNFINDLRNETINRSECTICNYCVAKMYSGQIACHLNEKNLPAALQAKIAVMEKNLQTSFQTKISEM